MKNSLKNEDQLCSALLDYVKEYKIINNWSQEQFKAEIIQIIGNDSKTLSAVKLEDLNIDDLYDIILDLGMHI